MGKEGPSEIFQVVKKGKEYKLEMNPALRKDIVNSARANTHIKGIDKLLNIMAKQVKTYGLSGAEQKTLWHALKNKWERELSFGFERKFHAEENPVLAARMLTNELFGEVNQTIGKKLAEYSDIVESEVVGAADKGDFKDIMREISPATEQELAALWARQARKAPKSKHDRSVETNAYTEARKAHRRRKRSR